jgi:hypothetical protein
LGLSVALLLAAAPVRAETVAAEPLTPIAPAGPAGVAPEEVRIVFHVVVEIDGRVSSVVLVARSPATAPDAYVVAARLALESARFRPTRRDSVAVRSRIEWVVEFHGPAANEKNTPADAAPAEPEVEPERENEPVAIVEVHGERTSPPRGMGDLRLSRDELDRAPHVQTSELLSSAPGFFVDHEDGEGLGNDVFLRGFDLEHGSGIETRVDGVPVNVPTHILGPGYVDLNFVIPELVENVHVLEGPYDPRQGDAALVGSAAFELGVPERGYGLKASYGSFGQARVLGVAAPAGQSDDTFLALAARHTDGFGARRRADSAVVNGGYGVELGRDTRLRLFGAGYAARATLPGVLREDDIDARRIDYYGSYPYFGDHQSADSSIALVGAELDHRSSDGAHFSVTPFFMWTDFRARQNFTGALTPSPVDPTLPGPGDWLENTNGEIAGGVTASARSKALRIARDGSLVLEGGIYTRFGSTEQQRSLIDPISLVAWERRLDASVGTLDTGVYADADLRLNKYVHLSGGVRGDLLAVTVDDRLASDSSGATAPSGGAPDPERSTTGVALCPRATLELLPLSSLAFSASYGEGFRSVAPEQITDHATPYSKVRSTELGMRVADRRRRIVATAVVFATWVDSELVFDAESGGLESESPSLRSGVVSSLVAQPASFLFVSSALSVTSAEFRSRPPGAERYVPNVPPILWRTDVTTRGKLGELWGESVTGSAIVGYTFMAGSHLSDAIVGPSNNVLNVGGRVRRSWLELSLDVYNALGLRYPDDAAVYVSNLNVGSRPVPASTATHIQAAPPRTWLASIGLHF